MRVLLVGAGGQPGDECLVVAVGSPDLQGDFLSRARLADQACNIGHGGNVVAFDTRDDVAETQPALCRSAAGHQLPDNHALGLGSDGDLPERIQCLSAHAEHAAATAAT